MLNYYFNAHYHPPFMQTASNHFLSLLQCSGVLPVLRRFCEIGIMLRSRSLFISLSFAPYHRAPFTPSFADGGVQRPLALCLPYFPRMVESHLTPTPTRRIVIGQLHNTRKITHFCISTYGLFFFVRRPPLASSSAIALYGAHYCLVLSN